MSTTLRKGHLWEGGQWMGEGHKGDISFFLSFFFKEDLRQIQLNKNILRTKYEGLD